MTVPGTSPLPEHDVIRPAAVLPPSAAREVVVELAHDDVRAGGVWLTGPTLWQRYDRPFDGVDGGPGHAELLGSLQVSYGVPTRLAVTVFASYVTQLGREHGWTAETLCDDALGFGGYTLATCPRSQIGPVLRVVSRSA